MGIRKKFVQAPKEKLISYSGLTAERWEQLGSWKKLEFEREWRETTEGRQFQTDFEEQQAQLQAERDRRMREWQRQPNEPA